MFDWKILIRTNLYDGANKSGAQLMASLRYLINLEVFRAVARESSLWNVRKYSRPSSLFLENLSKAKAIKVLWTWVRRYNTQTGINLSAEDVWLHMHFKCKKCLVYFRLIRWFFRNKFTSLQLKCVVSST